MKEEWKVYIKGVPNRGDEVIKILKDLGAKNSNEYKCCYADYLYYIGHDGNIHLEYEEREEAKIIMDNYKEIKLPEQWKNGDILYSDTDKEFAVFKDKWKLDSDKFLAYFATCHGGYLTLQAIRRRDFRLTTKLEVEQFYEYLHSIGKDWDAEKKQVVDWRWTPEMTHKFYFVDINGKVKIGIHDKETDNVMFDFGNCFRTKDEAERMAEKFKKLLKDKL